MNEYSMNEVAINSTRITCDSDSETGLLRQDSTLIFLQIVLTFNRCTQCYKDLPQSYVFYVETCVGSVLTRTTSRFFYIEIHRVVLQEMYFSEVKIIFRDIKIRKFLQREINDNRFVFFWKFSVFIDSHL